jgi:hypothetical protein
MLSINTFHTPYATTFAAILRAKGMGGSDVVKIPKMLPNDLTDTEYADLAAVVVACDVKVVPDLMKLIATLRPQVKETPVVD